MILTIITSLFGFAGFSIAFYIHNKKQKKKKLICPMRSNCEKVIHSDYSKILGLSVEVLGMTYYAFICIFYITSLFIPLDKTYSLVLFVGSLCSVLFSFYLIFVQAFILRQWCVWCLSSAVISVLICALSYRILFL
jgi:uncharacterized membrane protein